MEDVLSPCWVSAGPDRDCAAVCDAGGPGQAHGCLLTAGAPRGYHTPPLRLGTGITICNSEFLTAVALGPKTNAYQTVVGGSRLLSEGAGECGIVKAHGPGVTLAPESSPVTCISCFARYITLGKQPPCA